MKLTTQLIAACVTALLTACANTAEIRMRPPDMSLKVAGQFDLIAECTVIEADRIREIPAVLRIDRRNQIAYLFEPIPPSGSAVSYDITFAQMGSTVQIDGRGMQTIHGTKHHISRVWPAVESCVKGAPQ